MAFFDPPQPPRPDRPPQPDLSSDPDAGDRTAQPTFSLSAVTFTPQMIVGSFILLLGVLLTLDALAIIEAGRVTPTLLSLGVVVWGVALLTRRTRGHRFWGFVMCVFGTSLLLRTLGVVYVGFWQLFWPLAMVIVGGALVLQTLRRGSPRPEDGASQPWSPFAFKGRRPIRPHLFAVMGEDKRTITDNPFRGGEMTAFMGGCVMDLRQAVIRSGEQATIDVFGVMCGHELYVPENWVVTSRIVPIMGGVDDKRVLPPPVPGAPGGPSEGSPRLLLRGMVIMGGFVIKRATS
jgi:hypothetical protein